MPQKFSSHKKILIIFVGPVIALILYLFLYSRFMNIPGREPIVTFAQLFLVVFFIIFAWDFIFFFFLFRGDEYTDRFEHEQQSFLSQAGHQLRTPLTSMRWSLEMLLKGDAGAISQNQKDILEKLSYETDLLNQLIKKLLIIDHLESRRQIVIPGPISMKTVISDVLKEHDFASNGKNLERIRVVEPPIPWPEAYADPDMIREVLFNLISNALHYSPPENKVTVQGEVKDRNLVMSVSDLGVGISPELRDKIFTKFSRGENAKGKNSGGIGLGLFIAYSFVTLLGGKMWFMSENGNGTTFSFSLPLAKFFQKPS